MSGEGFADEGGFGHGAGIAINVAGGDSAAHDSLGRLQMRTTIDMKVFFLALLTLVSGTFWFAAGQTPTGTISGQVRDPSEAVVAGARVIATATATAIPHATTTDAGGNYQIPLLPIGGYTLRVEASGFQTIERSGLILVVDQHMDLNFNLQVGNVSDTVTVTGDTAQLQTEQGSIGTVLDQQKVVELPLNSRTFYSLAYMVPGVVPPANNSYNGWRGGFNVAGAPENTNNFTLDGFDNNNEQLGNPSFRPSVDAIQEFKVLTGVYSAEYGHDAGGQVIVTGKSGSNQFHGLAFEYFRNQDLDAKNFFAPAGPAPAYKRNQFGGTFGGPIVRNKTFFFFNYEGLRLHQQLSVLTTVPTQAMLAGDFSSILPATQLKDPFTGTPIPGNKLPSIAQWNTPASSIGRALAAYYPAPTYTTAAGAKPSNNYLFNALATDGANQNGLRIDHYFSSRDFLYATSNYSNDPSVLPYNTLCASRTIPGFGCNSVQSNDLSGISETHTFSPALVNVVRFSYNLYHTTRAQQDGSIDFIGTNHIPNVFLGPAGNNKGLPSTTVTGYAAIGGPTNNPQDVKNNEFQFADQVIWIRRAHSLKFGADVRRNRQNALSILTGRGAFNFTASTSAPTTGYALADMLAGLPTTTSNNPYAPKIYVFTLDVNGFVQDDWKVSSRLTVNIGLRWELNSPFTAQDNQESSFSPADGKVVQAGTGRYGANLVQYNYKLFEPRFGFAYKLDDKTVLRAGYGIYGNAPTSFAGIGNLFYNVPMRNPQTFNSSVATPLLLSNPFPTGTSGGTSAPYGIDYVFKPAYVHQYGFGIQRQLTTNILLDVSYFGSRGLHLPDQININQPAAQSAVTATAGVNALRPYPAFGNIIWYQSAGISSFNSLQAKFEKRFSHGVNLLASYTYGKSLDNTPGFNGSNASNAQPQNSRNLRSEYGLSDFDNRHRLSVSGVYQFPFGKDGRWLRNGVGAMILGGWQFSEIFSTYSARPFTIYYSSNVSNTLNLHDRPNIVGDLNAGPKTPTQWFNAAAISTPPTGTFGNEGRNAVAGPGFFDLDTTLSRDFRFAERYSLKFRAEYFNVLNHPNFDLPGATVAGSGFNTIPTAADPRQLQLALRFSF